ncbi:MAG: helix-turn-helix transcriptional regulator [Ruminococcus sp.]|nr:helix-turn-helix transcriptional regulator [Ruminococcus sp.]
MRDVNRDLINRDKLVEKLKINQIKTAENIIRVREEKRYSQTKVANEMGISRTHYCNIENGNRDITKDYLKRLADYFEVDYDDLVVYEEDYSKGFYDGLEYLLDYLDKDCFGLKSYVFNFKYSKGTDEHSSFLTPFLYSMGYEVYVVDSETVKSKYYHPVPFGIDDNGKTEWTVPEIEDLFEDRSAYLIVKNGCALTYCSPNDFKRFEKLIQNQIDVYFDNSFKYFLYQTCTCPTLEQDNISVIDELKKQLSEIKNYMGLFEKMIDKEEKRAQSERDGDDI